MLTLEVTFKTSPVSRMHGTPLKASMVWFVGSEYPFSNAKAVAPPLGKTFMANVATLAFRLVTRKDETTAVLAAGTVYIVVSVAAVGVRCLRRYLFDMVSLLKGS